MNILLIIAYVGTMYSGFQIQKNRNTIQGQLERALKEFYGEAIRVVGSGRTDEGVHAIGQAVNYIAPRNIPISSIVSGINHFLPDSILVKSAREVAPDFNARFSAIKKTYIYKFYFSELVDPFFTHSAMRISPKINIEKMSAAAKLFEGEHDFNAFRCYGSSSTTTVRTVYDCQFILQQSKDIVQPFNTALLKITANGFLYKMVRLIAGAIVKVGNGRLSLEELQFLIDSGAFYASKLPAPSCGLYLLEVEY